MSPGDGKEERVRRRACVRRSRAVPASRPRKLTHIRADPPCRLLAVHTPAGKHVLVHGCSHEQLETIQTGMEIEVSGGWEQAPAGGRRLASASNAFKATTIRLGKPAFAAPAVTTSGSIAAGMTMSASAVAPAVTRSTNQLVKKDLSAIFVPSKSSSAAAAPQQPVQPAAACVPLSCPMT